jgi:hypothetical protein
MGYLGLKLISKAAMLIPAQNIRAFVIRFIWIRGIFDIFRGGGGFVLMNFKYFGTPCKK